MQSTNRTTIATSCLDPVSKILKGYYAAPNQAVAVGSTNYRTLRALGDDNKQYNTRGDINLGNQNIFVRYST